MNSNELISKLKDENVQTWFDLGLLLDRIKENPVNKPSSSFKSYNDFKNHLTDGGIAFISFFYSVDGASTECLKYVSTLQDIIPGFKVHYIAGKFYDTGKQFLYPNAKSFTFDELRPFDEWDLYDDFFNNKLERGSKIYNRLIKAFWKQTLLIAEKLSAYIEKNDIRLLYLINVNSNPGNVSQALALVLISEYMEIPVINNCHDFYWEEGHSDIEREERNLKSGPRDHFFKNFHLGEVFSLIEMIYPWDSRKWLSLNINRSQCEELIKKHGQNPANVQLIETCVDVDKYKTILSKERRLEVLQQIDFIFRQDKKRLHCYSFDSFPKLKDTTQLFPVMFSERNQKITNFDQDNILLLQPTRILKRKAIEVDFRLISKLFNDYEVLDNFDENENLKITILITGPVAIGNISYFYTLINEFQKTLKSIKPAYRSRVFLGFMFSAFDKEDFKSKFENPFDLNELYKTSTMILLPSTTEGRGLPIIEAAACGIPVFCRRYSPEHVFAHVIGEHLPKVHRLNVISFRDPDLDEQTIESVKQHIFAPKAFESINRRNKEIVKNRYSFASLKDNLNTILYKLYLQVNSGVNEVAPAQEALSEYEDHLKSNKPYAKNLLNTENREYLAGFGQMRFMLMLKSLIDPSYFRIEEKYIRGFAMQFSKELIENTPDPSPLPVEDVHKFYNAVDRLFKLREGELQIRIDHSMSYRHRNKYLYPYRKYTPQELTGVINILYHNFTSPPPVIIQKPKEVTYDWHLNIANLYDNAPLEIDHIDDLEKRLMENIPIAFFPGKYIELEFETFILAPVRARLKLAPKEKIDDTNIIRKNLAPIYIIANQQALGNLVTANILKSVIFYKGGREIHTLFKHGICKIIESEQKSIGLHFYEIGKKASAALQKIKLKKGILITTGDHAAMMTDIVSLDRFHIGTVGNMFTAKIMGIPFGSSYVQWVPPGLRFALAYPTPIQTGKSFSQSLKGFRFKRLTGEMGQKQF